MDRVSIVICTYNRADSLKLTLDSIYAHYHRLPIDVIVVDNNSNDHTAAICAEFANYGVQRVFQPVMGLSHARNTGLQHTERPIVVFIDDDVTIQADWLENLTAPFANKKVGAVGGELLPVWEQPRPDWLTDQWLHFYSVLLRWSRQPREISGCEWLCEGNIAFRRQALAQCGNFPVQLGRIGPLLLSGEGAVINVMRHHGWQAMFMPQALVNHHIPAARMQPAWLAKRIFWQGISESLMEQYILEKTGQNDSRFQWRDLRLPTDMKTWASLLNPQADTCFDYHMRQIQDLGYAMQKTGLIGN